MFPEIESTLQAIFRWFHILAGITWIGHLYFFNFVNAPVPGRPGQGAEAEGQPAAASCAPSTSSAGARCGRSCSASLLFCCIYCAEGGALFDADGGMSERAMWILFGGLLGTIMWFNVWFVIWPRQKKILGAMLGGPAAPPEAAPQAALASKINTYLSGPMLWGMVAGSHINLWPMNFATLGLALVTGPGPDPRAVRLVAQGEDDGLVAGLAAAAQLQQRRRRHQQQRQHAERAAQARHPGRVREYLRDDLLRRGRPARVQRLGDDDQGLPAPARSGRPPDPDGRGDATRRRHVHLCGIGRLQAGRRLDPDARAVRRAVDALHGHLDVAVVEDPDVARRQPDGRGAFGGRRRVRGLGRGPDQDAAAQGEDGRSSRYWTLPVIAKCARRFRAQQASLDSWQSGISLP